ncbi:MAG: hypothetical protein H6582_10275 [Crocinitomicaceae bacterium]|nr:hypothetical protein [Crocinitomicaceae bacterium]
MRILFVVIAITAVMSTRAQNQERDWKINAAFSFAPGFITENTRTIQLHGYLGYLQDHIQVRGDAFYFLGSSGDRPRFEYNHHIYTGAFYHFTESSFQPYVGFQPGIAIAKSSEYQTLNSSTNALESKVATSPVGSAVGGFTYFGEKWFFLFFETRYIFGKHKSNAYPVYLDELRLSFGLGFTF